MQQDDFGERVLFWLPVGGDRGAFGIAKRVAVGVAFGESDVCTVAVAIGEPERVALKVAVGYDIGADQVADMDAQPERVSFGADASSNGVADFVAKYFAKREPLFIANEDWGLQMRWRSR